MNFNIKNINGNPIFAENIGFVNQVNSETNKNKKTVFEIGIDLCNHLKFLIEEKGALKNLDISEDVFQNFFYSIAQKFCIDNNLDINREPKIGIGEPDFKMSKGQEIVIIELKLSTNNNLISGYTKQLPRYNTSEQSNNSIYLILKTDNSIDKINNLFDLKNQNIQLPELFVINGQKQITASKIK